MNVIFRDLEVNKTTGELRIGSDHGVNHYTFAISIINKTFWGRVKEFFYLLSKKWVLIRDNGDKRILVNVNSVAHRLGVSQENARKLIQAQFDKENPSWEKVEADNKAVEADNKAYEASIMKEFFQVNHPELLAQFPERLTALRKFKIYFNFNGVNGRSFSVENSDGEGYEPYLQHVRAIRDSSGNLLIKPIKGFLFKDPNPGSHCASVVHFDHAYEGLGGSEEGAAVSKQFRELCSRAT